MMIFQFDKAAEDWRIIRNILLAFGRLLFPIITCLSLSSCCGGETPIYHPYIEDLDTRTPYILKIFDCGRDYRIPPFRYLFTDIYNNDMLIDDRGNVRILLLAGINRVFETEMPPRQALDNPTILGDDILLVFTKVEYGWHENQRTYSPEYYNLNVISYLPLVSVSSTDMCDSNYFHFEPRIEEIYADISLVDKSCEVPK